MKRSILWMGMAFWAFSGCGQEEARPKPGPSVSPPRMIVWVTPLAGHPVYAMQNEGFLWAAKDYGFKPVCVGPSRIDPPGMVREMENAIAQKVDGIVTVPFNWDAFQGVYEKARAAKIPVVNAGADTPDDWRLAFIGTDNRAYGRESARILVEKMKGKANLCIMMSRLDVQNQLEQKQSFEEAIRNHPGMRIVVVETDQADRTTAVEKFRQVFRTHPRVDTVWMLEATGGGAAAQVAAEMGILDRVTILAIDDVPETVEEIRKGRIWGTLAQNFYRMGYESARMIMDSYDRKPVPSVTDSGSILVTRENLDTYRKSLVDAIQRKAP